MKGIKSILGIALATTGLGGAVAVGAASFNISDNRVEVTEAATTDKVIYIDLSLNSKFLEGSANPWVRYYNGSQNYVQLVHVSNNIYKTNTAIPAAVLTNSSYGFEAYCFNQAEKNNDCTTKWIFGNGYLQHDNYNYVCIGSFVSGKQNEIKGYGYYESEISNPGPSSSTQRVWLKNDTPNFYDNDDWSTACKNVIGYMYNSKWVTIEMNNHRNYNQNYYFYADIPSSVTSVHFFRCSRNSNHKYLYYLDAYVDTLVYGKCYYSGTANYGDFVNITAGSVSDADAYLLRAVVEAYLTCSSAASNGCATATVTNLKDTWFANRADDGTNGSISELTFDDYSNGDTTYTGSKSRSTTVLEKWNAMCSKASVTPSNNIISYLTSNNSPVTYIAATAGILTIGVAGYFFLRKKKLVKE